ncbi:type 1 fimbrial protein [Serratia sp. JUb9]|uniref:fimbrial protein n=1 Tax=Serratia sp. JUb9 TaxID=2724469 RepID=UPI00164E9B98|nr:fimbrial protein [Serratia sp. JUb9]QNK33228.1 type 1 fimbrial protein [Serratia sp. JUb9]
MKQQFARILKNTLLIAFALMSGSALAIDCHYTAQAWGEGGDMGSIPEDSTVDLGGITISVGEDIPVGSVVFTSRQSSIANLTNGVACNAPFDLTSNIDYLTKPLPIASWSGSPTVYETGVPGLAVYLSTYDSKNPFPQHLPYINNAPGGGFKTQRTGYDLSIIKIGPVTPGIINGAQLPTLRETIPAKAGYTGLPLTLKTLRFSGSLLIKSETCITPDLTVNLGKYDTSQIGSIGAATPWINSSLQLKDCPIFYGYYPKAAVNWQSGSGTLNQGTANRNMLGLSLRPNNGIIDATQGIMAIASGSNAASGIGIQIASGEVSGSPVNFNFSQEKPYYAPSGEGKNYRLPLVARYIRTEKEIKPGQANGNLTFTITYK